MESKNRLLRSVAGEGIDQIGQLQARWDKFELMMESHELMIKEQVVYYEHFTMYGINVLDTVVSLVCQYIFIRYSMGNVFTLTCIGRSNEEQRGIQGTSIPTEFREIRSTLASVETERR